jgi:6-phosphogluconolactonase (cycloisomerase 2 family)
MSSDNMSSAILRIVVIPAILAGLFALAGCGGSGTKVCNATGCCGQGNAQCPAPPSHIYATGIDGKVSIFTVYGAPVGAPTSVSGPASTFGMAALSNRFLYVSNPDLTVGGTSSIDAWSIDLNTGGLSPLPASPFPLGSFTLANGLAVNTAAQVLYVADSGKIDALQADATGALTFVTGSPFASGTNFFLTVDPGNRFVFASDEDPPGSISAFTIAASGALTQVPGSPFAANPNGSGSQPRQIVVDSTGNFAYTVLLSTNQVAAFSIVQSSGALTPVPGSPFATGNGPVALATVDNFLYVSNVQDGTISGFTIDATTGILSPIPGSPFAFPGGPLTTDNYGGFLYTASADGMLTFSIDGSTGALTQVGSAVPYDGATVLTYVQ